MSSVDFRFYEALGRLPFGRYYFGKVFWVAFVGTHVPVIALISYLLFSPMTVDSRAWSTVVIVLLATELGLALTLYGLFRLLQPLRVTSRVLRRFVRDGMFPDLPIRHHDEMGLLMADAPYTLLKLAKSLANAEQVASHDYLTGLYNRRGAEECLSRDLARCS